MDTQNIKALLESLPEARGWPEFLAVFDRTESIPHPDWQLPVLSCVASGGQEEWAHSCAAAIACIQISIILADDMLDEDPRGEHQRRGPGEAANLALGFQSAAFKLLDQAPLNDHQRARIAGSLSRASLATAAGQQLDAKNLKGEENYWRVVQSKSTPFYGSAYQVGAICARAEPVLETGLYQFGALTGEIIQVDDDLTDAFEKPANPDWVKQSTNLLVVYALDAEYPEKARFRSLLPGVVGGDAVALDEAQQLLIRSGAVSYAVHHLLVRYRRAHDLLDHLPLPKRKVLSDVLDRYGERLVQFLRLSGAEVSASQLRFE